MARKPKFGVPAEGDASEIPPYLQGRKKAAKVLQDPTPDDFAWIGDDGQFDAGATIAELVTPQALLYTVVEQIVRANPQSGEAVEDRTAAAVRALVGIRRGRGRPTDASYDKPLKLMTEQYFLAFFGFGAPRRSLNDLCLWALRQDPAFEKRSVEDREHRKKTLVRRFNAQKDELLARFSAENGAELQAASAKVQAVLSSLRGLGISVDVPTPR